MHNHNVCDRFYSIFGRFFFACISLLCVELRTKYLTAVDAAVNFVVRFLDGDRSSFQIDHILRIDRERYCMRSRARISTKQQRNHSTAHGPHGPHSTHHRVVLGPVHILRPIAVYNFLYDFNEFEIKT